MRVLYFCNKVTPALLKKLYLDYGTHEIILIQYKLTTHPDFINPAYTYRMIHHIKIENVKIAPTVLLNIQEKMNTFHKNLQETSCGYLKKIYYMSAIACYRLIFHVLRIIPDVFFTQDKSFYWERKNRYDADLTLLNEKVLYKN